MIVDNRRARHDYHLSDRVEAGLVLAGTEVKALRDGKATLQQAYADVREGEAWLIGLHIPEYGQGNRANHEPDRPRKLLMHRREITLLASRNALPADFDHIIRLIENGGIDTTPWITHRATFEEMIEAFPSWLKPETGVIKAMVQVQ